VYKNLLKTYLGQPDQRWWNDIVLRQSNVEQVNKIFWDISVWTQSRQSARFFLQSSKLGLLHLLSRRRVCSPLLWLGRGVHTRLRGGWGFPIPMRGQTLWYSRYICTMWVWIKVDLTSKVKFFLSCEQKILFYTVESYSIFFHTIVRF